MQVPFTDGGASTRSTAGLAKPSTHLPVSPSKSKPAVLSNQRPTHLARALVPSELGAFTSKPVCFEGHHLSAQILPIASPPRSPLSNLTNLTNSSTRIRKLQLSAVSNASFATDSTQHNPDCETTQSGFTTPITAAPASACSPSAPVHQHTQIDAHQPESNDLPLNASDSTHIQPAPIEAVMARLSFKPPVPSSPASAVLTPTTPEISEGMPHLRQSHTDGDVASDVESIDVDDAKDVVPAGEIHLFLGPMFAGKSTSLLNSVRDSIADGRSVAIIKSHKDDRYANNFVVTHTGDKEACYAVPTLRAFKEQVPDAYQRCDVIAIDEGQFFTDLFEFCLQAADGDGKIIFIAGLDGDFQRRKFGSVLDLIPYADTVTKLHSNCAFCSKKGLFSLRISADTRQEVVGGADQYRPVCRQHYLQLSSTRSPSMDSDAECADD